MIINAKQLREAALLLGENEDTTEFDFSIGDGHSGYGLYIWDIEYPEEGSCFLGEQSQKPPIWKKKGTT